jgi:hypothetical protein
VDSRRILHALSYLNEVCAFLFLFFFFLSPLWHMYLHEYLSFSLCGICQTVSVFNVLKQRKKPYFNDASNHDVIYGLKVFLLHV